MSSTGRVKASPVRAYQMRLTYALANQGLSWPVTNAAPAWRRSAALRPFGKGLTALARKNLGATAICVCGFFRSGIVYRGLPGATTSKICGWVWPTRRILVPAKNEANSWNCCRFHESLGWSWHWAH